MALVGFSPYVRCFCVTCGESIEASVFSRAIPSPRAGLGPNIRIGGDSTDFSVYLPESEPLPAGDLYHITPEDFEAYVTAVPVWNGTVVRERPLVPVCVCVLCMCACVCVCVRVCVCKKVRARVVLARFRVPNRSRFRSSSLLLHVVALACHELMVEGPRFQCILS